MLDFMYFVFAACLVWHVSQYHWQHWYCCSVIQSKSKH